MAKYLVIVVLLVAGLLIIFPDQGKAAAAQQSIRSADPILYGLSSFVLPGLGQFLLGYRGTAFLHFLVAVAVPVACYYVSFLTPFFLLYPMCGVASLAWHAYSAVDAYDRAVAGGASASLVP